LPTILIKPVDYQISTRKIGIDVYNKEDYKLVGITQLSTREARNLACELLNQCERLDSELDKKKEIEGKTFSELDFKKDMLF